MPNIRQAVRSFWINPSRNQLFEITFINKSIIIMDKDIVDIRTVFRYISICRKCLKIHVMSCYMNHVRGYPYIKQKLSEGDLSSAWSFTKTLKENARFLFENVIEWSQTLKQSIAEFGGHRFHTVSVSMSTPRFSKTSVSMSTPRFSKKSRVHVHATV